MNISRLLKSLDLDSAKLKSGDLAARSPIDGSELARLKSHTPAQVGAAIGKAAGAFQVWREVPAGGSARLGRSACVGRAAAQTSLAWRWPLERRFDRSALLRATDTWACLPGLLRADGALRTPRAWYRWQFDGDAATWSESGWRRDNRMEFVFHAASPETGAELSGEIEAVLLAALRPDR